jgi:phosphate-selective porin
MCSPASCTENARAEVSLVNRIGFILIGLVLFSPLPLEAADAEFTHNIKFEFKHRPALQVGEFLRVELEAKVQTDLRRFSPVLPGVSENQWSKARLGLKGSLFEHFHYEIEREFRGTLGFERPMYPWTDVYIEARDYRPFDLKLGKFKLPFGMEQTTSAAKLDFVYRARASDLLTPGRDKGFLLEGRTFKEQHVEYAAGIFSNDGENSHAKGLPAKTGGLTIAARIRGEPLRTITPRLERLQIGAAVASSNVPETGSVWGNSLRGETAAEETFFHRVFVQGRRLRFGTEMNWTNGPFVVKGEFIHVSEQRKGVGIDMQDLPDLISQGWYLTGKWLIAGKRTSKAVVPKENFLTARGIGALEAAARYESLRFGSAGHVGIASRSPRSGNVLVSSDRAVTLGLNWYWNRFTKIQINGIREILEDPREVPVPGRTRYWTTVVRLQFDM